MGDLNSLAFFIQAKGVERMSLDVDAFKNKSRIYSEWKHAVHVYIRRIEDVKVSNKMPPME